jgi:hypothetical protein
VFRDGVFVVSAFAHPPAEPHNVTKDFLAGVNLFGGTGALPTGARDLCPPPAATHEGAAPHHASTQRAPPPRRE